MIEIQKQIPVLGTISNILKFISEHPKISLVAVLAGTSGYLVYEGNEQIACIAQNVAWEGDIYGKKPQPREGLEAIAAVTMARVLSQNFPNEPCKVVFHKVNGVPQFSWTANNRKIDFQHSGPLWEEALQIARKYAGTQNVQELAEKTGPLGLDPNTLYYKRTDGIGVSKRGGAFFRNLFPVVTIGEHTFYEYVPGQKPILKTEDLPKRNPYRQK